MQSIDMRTNKQGFTLIEILIAVAIVAIMVVTVGPNIMKMAFKGKRDATKTRIAGVKQSLQAYYLDLSEYPEKLRDLVKKPAEARKWDGPYIDEEPRDAWDRRFQYKRTPGGKHPYELYSYGENGQGAPKEEQISVWDN